MTEVIDGSEVIFVGSGDAEHFLAFGVAEEFAVFVEQFEGIPLFGVMRGGENQAAASVLGHNGDFSRRRRGEADIDDVEAHRDEGSDDDVRDHLARETGVAADNDGVARAGCCLFDEFGICSRKLDDVDGGESVTCLGAEWCRGCPILIL